MINRFLESRTLENLMLCSMYLSRFTFDKKNYHLKKLFLCDCNLSKLSESILNLKQLQCLNLTLNKLKIVPPILSELKNLKELVLRDNPIESYENISFHSLETLHMGCGEETLKLKIYMKNRSSLKYLHVYRNIMMIGFSEVSFDSSTIEDLKGLYQYPGSTIHLLEHKDTLKNLEFLHLCGDFNENDAINIISVQKNLRELHIRLYTCSRVYFLKNIFSALKLHKNLEYLVLKDCSRDISIDNVICPIESLKKLRIHTFSMKEIVRLSQLKNLKYVWFEDMKFYQSKDVVNLFLKEKKIKVVYKQCIFNYNPNQY